MEKERVMRKIAVVAETHEATVANFTLTFAGTCKGLFDEKITLYYVNDDRMYRLYLQRLLKILRLNGLRV